MSKHSRLVGMVAGCLALGTPGAWGAGAEASAPTYGNSLGQPAPAADMALPVPTLDVSGSPALGSAEAPVTIVEFLDYQCPYCQEYAKTTYAKLKAGYIDTGKLRYVARDFPLPKHQRARPAAIAAGCAGEQDKFWPMHEALLTDAGQLADADFERHARKLALDLRAFDACRARGNHGERLDADLAAGRAVGVSGTPSFLVGSSRGGSAQGRVLKGAPSYEEFEKILAGYLQPAGKPVGKPVGGT